MKYTYQINFIFSLPLCISLIGCTSTQQISYQRDIHPIIESKCIGCHTPPYGDGYRKTGLDMSSYKSILEGSIYGPVIMPGNSKMSPLNMLVEGRAGNLSREMDNRHKPITENDIQVLQLWVEQGAKNN
mgnify:FL=1